MPTPLKDKPTSFRISRLAVSRLAFLQRRWELSRAMVLERLLREAAEREGMPAPAPDAPDA